MIIIFPAEIAQKFVKVEEPLKAFTKEDICAGETTAVQDRSFSLVLWGDNAITQEKDGFFEGEGPRFSISDDELLVFSGGDPLLYNTQKIVVVDSVFRDSNLSVEGEEVNIVVGSLYVRVRASFSNEVSQFLIRGRTLAGKERIILQEGNTYGGDYFFDKEDLVRVEVLVEKNGRWKLLNAQNIPRDRIEIFPNPTRHSVNVYSQETVDVYVYEISGRPLLKTRGQGLFEVKLPQAAGGYFLVFLSENREHIETKKIVKF